MITIEIDSNSEEVFIHGEPANLRGFAQKLWAISEQAEQRGQYEEQLTTKYDSEIELSSTPRGDSAKRRAIQKLTISSSSSNDA